MSPSQLLFLQQVLGPEGAEVLRKASARDRRLASALLPRAILGWVAMAARSRAGYDGGLPGCDGGRLSLRKSELGWKGSVLSKEGSWSFEGASLFEIGAGVALALGMEPPEGGLSPRAEGVRRLGKSVDALVKARVALGSLSKKTLDPSLGYKISHEHHDLGGGKAMTSVSAHAPDGSKVGAATFMHQGPHIVPGSVVVDEDHQRKGLASAMYRHAEAQTGKKLAPSPNQTPEGAALWAGNAKSPQFGAQPAAKAELPGQSAKPKEQLGPQAPQGPAPQAAGAKQAKPPSLKPPPAPGSLKPMKSFKVTKSQASSKCPSCGTGHVEAGRLRGCLCHAAALAKSARAVPGKDGWELLLDPEAWDLDAVACLAASFGSERQT